MWIFTPFGFFSVVQKPGQSDLTVRARVESDLDALREHYLPSLTETLMTTTSDYRYRGRASHQAVADAMAQIARDITYDNFKNEVAARQGHGRANTYCNIWSVCWDLQEQHAE